MAETLVSAKSAIKGYGVEVAAGQIEALNGTVQEHNASKELALKVKRITVYYDSFGLENKWRIQEGISYLIHINGAPRNNPGPGNCGL
ncbi:hypothetical protein ED733_001218 [Metarhizium rileyi]|uniref:Uncharacterized protein n=1 Tax=Metarhizium rileyi (strain RCEF 4871) TaxID=1649241 RepID=A0A5C6FYT4_METRR|nr:hypothetical protein ED733_001218 [Metarhizium rileyi]